MILLSGITGRTGKHLVEQLLKKRVKLRAIVRDLSKVDYLANSNIELIEGDLEHLESLDHAFAGVERAFLLAGTNERQLDVDKAFIDSAKKMGVAHIVKYSAIAAPAGSESEIANMHRLAEQYLKESGLTYTIVQPQFFMQNMLELAGAIKQAGSFSLPMGSGRVAPVDTRDVAAALASILTEEGHNQRSYILSGTEALSFTQIADTLSSACHKPVGYSAISLQEFKGYLLSAGSDAWYAEALTGLFKTVQEDKQATVTTTLSELLGHAPTTFDAFAKEHAPAFSE